MTMSSKGQQFG